MGSASSFDAAQGPTLLSCPPANQTLNRKHSHSETEEYHT